MSELTEGLWRHKKTGGLYRIVMRCRIEASNEPAYAYLSQTTGIIWVRPMDEFLDGRFERVEEPAQKPEPVKMLGPVNCTHVLRREGKAYPRTCQRCGLGPCPFYGKDGLEKNKPGSETSTKAP